MLKLMIWLSATNGVQPRYTAHNKLRRRVKWFSWF